MQTHPVVDKLRAQLPPTFAGPKIDQLTGGAICWGTIQNKRSRREIPPECFSRSGAGPTIVDRDLFLDWWSTTLSEARQPFDKPPRATPPQPRAGKTRRSRAATAEPVALSASAPESRPRKTYRPIGSPGTGPA
jgi:hypothetical protein